MAARRHSATARDFKAGDDSRNARRREYRAAERYLRQAESSSGATREKMRQLAKGHFERALDTYDPSTKQDFAAPIKRLASEFGVDIYERRRQFADLTTKSQAKAVERYQKQKDFYENRSKEALESERQDPDVLREREALIIMNSEVGKRIMAGLVDKWSHVVSRDKTAEKNREAAQKAIFEYFNTDNWADVVDAIEKSVGESLYKMSGQDDFYDTVKTTIQDKVMDNTLIV